VIINKRNFKFLIIVNVLIIFITNCLFCANFKIIDFETKQPIKNANIKIIKSNKSSEIDKVVKSDINGEFILNLDKNDGDLTNINSKIIKISFLGYFNLIDTINLENYKNKQKFYLKKKIIYTEEVVTTGQFAPTTTQESAFSIKVINSERIAAQGAVNLKDVLSNELNVRLGQDNILGSSMSIRGVSGQNVKILIDGVPVIGRVGGNIDISQINLNNTEKIEIIEGPLSTVYGTDALGGVINIITKNKSKASYNLNTFVESVGNYNFDLNLNENIDDFSLLFNIGRNFFDGFDPINENQRNILWKPKEQLFGDATVKYKKENWDVKYTLQGFNETIQNKGALRLPYFETAFDDYYYTNRFTNSIYVKGKVYNNKYLDMIFSYNTFERIKNTYMNNLTILNKTLSTIPGDNDTTQINAFLARGTFSSDRDITNSDEKQVLSYQLGYDMNYEYIRGDRVVDTNRSKLGDNITDMGDYAGFLSFQYSPTNDLLIQPSIRYAHNTNYDSPIIPSLNIKANLFDNFLMRVSYSRGFRAPSLRELYLFFVDINHNIRGNYNLSAETSNTYSMNFEYNINTEKAIVKFEPKLFYNNISDQISLVFIENTLFSYVNIGKFISQGGELSVNCITEDVISKVGFSYIGRQNSLGIGIETPEIMYSPEFQANIMYDVRDYDLKLSMFYKFNGRLPGFQLDNNDNLQRFELNSFHTLDLTGSKTFFENKFNLSMGIKNVFNVTNIQSNIASTGGIHSSGTNQFATGVGRTFFTSFKVNL